METRSLGSSGPAVSAIGLGCMGMSGMYGPADRAESIATIHAALDAGITLLDTGDFYGMGHNELLIHEALQGRDRESAQISVKFGAQRDHGGQWLGYDARPAAVKTALAYTLNRLGTDYVDVYRPARGEARARPPPNPPGHGLCGRLPPRPAGSERADRGDRRGDRGRDPGRPRAPHRALRGGRGDHPARRRRASHLRPADRVQPH